MLTRYLTYSHFTLFTALAISAVAAYYSIIGLTAIFAAAFVPIVVMGVLLEVAKITTSVWLQRYWTKAEWYYKYYLVSAVVGLAFLTSMGIFGFLSKAHSDQSLVSGDVTSKIAIYDEKIKIARENIDANRRALKQLDEAVDQVMGRSTSEQGAERSVQIRRQQGPERQRLIREIETEQKKISELNEARAPIAAEVRKVEAEVGPIKYIAALIYGDDPDTNLLERAVRWVIILIVVVFDPLAIVLVLAANRSIAWERERQEEHEQEEHPPYYVADVGERPTEEEKQEIEAPSDSVPDGPLPPAEPPTQEPEPRPFPKTIQELIEQETPRDSQDPKFVDRAFAGLTVNEPQSASKPKESPVEQSYLFKPGVFFKWRPEPKEETPPTQEAPVELPTVEEPVVTVGVTVEQPLFSSDQEYVSFEGKSTSMAALRGIRPDLIWPSDKPWPSTVRWGTEFPSQALRADIFIRTDRMPHQVFKFEGQRWISLDRELNTSYLTDEYVQYLVNCINKSGYDPELLTSVEQELVLEHLSKNA